MDYSKNPHFPQTYCLRAGNWNLDMRLHIMELDPVAQRTRLVICGKFRPQYGHSVRLPKDDERTRLSVCKKCEELAL